jgi:Holliday junction resolvasome RuvABC endonuclease subunit
MPLITSYIGIDPGFSSGGIVVIDVYPSQVHELRLSSATESEIGEFFAGLYPRQYFAVIEQVASRPGQGVSSTFKFGQGYGFLRAMLIAHKIPFLTKTPATWQKEYIPVIKDEAQPARKKRLRAVAQRLFPQAGVVAEIADAYLLAHYTKYKVQWT